MRVKQRDSSDCGAACLASIARYYRLKLSVARIRQYAATDQNGTNINGLTVAAEKLGFEAKGVRGEAGNLLQIPLPAIAHVMQKGQNPHFLVIYKVNGSYIKVMDPLDGKLHKLLFNDFVKIWTGILLLLLPSVDFKPGDHGVSLVIRFWQLIRPFKSIFLQSLAGALIYTILGLSTSVFIQKITDNVLTDGNRGLLNTLGSIMVVLVVIQLVIGTVRSVFMLRTGQQIDARLLLGYYQHLLKLPQQFFDSMRTGELLSRINDAVRIRVFINDIAIGLIVNVCAVIFSFALMLVYYWKLTLLLLTVIPFYILVYLLNNHWNKHVQRRLMEHSAGLEAITVEHIHSVNTIKRFGLEKWTLNKVELQLEGLLRTLYRSAINGLAAATATETFNQLLIVALLWAGAGFVLDNRLSPGELFSFYALAGYFTRPAAVLINANKAMQDALIASQRLFEIMDLETAENTDPKIILTASLAGDIKFENVCFGYGAGRNIFEDLNLTIKKGEFTAITGASGSGKSTLMALLQNIYSLQDGSISVGKYDIKYYSNTSLCNVIGIIPQETHLFSGTVISNIAAGVESPDMQRIIDIATQLGIISFINELPQGFHTNAGGNGCTLSGGQKQRIAIARAIYRDPQIVIFDEATSALDNMAEQSVLHVIDWLLKEKKTVIVVSHRLSAICNADRIVVLDKGKVAEDGNHASLLAQQGLYLKLWSHQS